MNKTDRNEIDPVVARWETRGNDWIELYQSRNCKDYYYRGRNFGGGLGAEITNDMDAIAKMEAPGGQAFVLKLDRPSLRRTHTRRL